MKCRYVSRQDKTGGGYWEPGDVNEHPQAYLLVRLGVAEPADDECAAAASMTPTQQQAAQYAQLRTSRGIHPEDFEAYDAGVMVGYDETGDWLPGPNYQAWLEAQEQEQEDDGLGN